MSGSSLARSGACSLHGRTTGETPKGAKRPADVVSNAVHVMKIATGELLRGCFDALSLAADRRLAWLHEATDDE